MWLLPPTTADNRGACLLAGFPQADAGEEATGSIHHLEAKRFGVKVVPLLSKVGLGSERVGLTLAALWSPPTSILTTIWTPLRSLLVTSGLKSRSFRGL